MEQENGFEAMREITSDPLYRLDGGVRIRRIDEKTLGLVTCRKKGVIRLEARRDGLESGARRFPKTEEAQIGELRTRSVQDAQAGKDLCDHGARRVVPGRWDMGPRIGKRAPDLHAPRALCASDRYGALRYAGPRRKYRLY